MRQSSKLNNRSMSIGSENINPNSISFGALNGNEDGEAPPSPWTLKRKSILKNSDNNANKIDSGLNV